MTDRFFIFDFRRQPYALLPRPALLFESGIRSNAQLIGYPRPLGLYVRKGRALNRPWTNIDGKQCRNAELEYGDQKQV